MVADLADAVPHAGVIALLTRCAESPGTWIIKCDVEDALVRDRADGVVASAVLVDLVGCGATTILSTSISVSARLSSADRSSHASDGSGSSPGAARPR
jgi:hypothetical protein